MEGLTQSYMFKQKLLSCEPIDLNRFVVDLRDRHLEFWTPFSDNHPRERNSKRVNLSPVVRNACTKSTGDPSSHQALLMSSGLDLWVLLLALRGSG